MLVLVTITLIISAIISVAASNLKVRATSEPISKIVGIDKNNQYIDEFGRQRFFRGLNVVCTRKCLKYF